MTLKFSMRPVDLTLKWRPSTRLLQRETHRRIAFQTNDERTSEVFDPLAEGGQRACRFEEEVGLAQTRVTCRFSSAQPALARTQSID